MHLGSKKFSVISTVVLASVLANPAYAIDSASPSPKPVAGWVSIKPAPGNPMVRWIIGTKTKVFDCVAATTEGRLAIKGVFSGCLNNLFGENGPKASEAFIGVASKLTHQRSQPRCNR